MVCVMVLPSIWLLALGCAEDSPPAESAPVESIELGAGLSAFSSVEDGDALPLVHGLQGGWHVDVALRAWGISPEGVQLNYQAVDSVDGALLSHPTEATLDARRVRELEDGWERLGDRVIFDVSSAGEVLGRELVLEVVLTGVATTLHDQRRVVVEEDAGR